MQLKKGSPSITKQHHRWVHRHLNTKANENANAAVKIQVY
jgi:hypothetical protein